MILIILIEIKNMIQTTEYFIIIKPFINLKDINNLAVNKIINIFWTF